VSGIKELATLQGTSCLIPDPGLPPGSPGSLKPAFLPGEQIEVRIVKPGEEAGQGVGYLDDGTTVVVESGREHVNRQVNIAATSVLQTSAGRMVFGRYESSR